MKSWWFVVVLLSLGSCNDNENAAYVIKINDGVSLSKVLLIAGVEESEFDLEKPDEVFLVAPTLGTHVVPISPNACPEIIISETNNSIHHFNIQIEGSKRFFSIPNQNALRVHSINKKNTWSIPLEMDGLKKYNLEEGFLSGIYIYGITPEGDWLQPLYAHVKVVPAKKGKLTFTLTWDKPGADLDLLVIEPTGDSVFTSYGQNVFRSKHEECLSGFEHVIPSNGNGAHFDFDNSCGYGPENIYYPDFPSRGEYKVVVKYSREDNVGAVRFRLSIGNAFSKEIFLDTLKFEGDGMVFTFNNT